VLLLAAAIPSVARADYTSDLSKINDVGNKTAVKSELTDWGWQSTLSDSAVGGLTEAETASGVLPAFAPYVLAIPAITIGSTTVAKVADGLGLGNFIYRKWTGENYTPVTSSWTGTYSWEYLSTGPHAGAYDLLATGSPSGVSGGSHGDLYCLAGGSFNNSGVDATMHAVAGVEDPGTASGVCAATNTTRKVRTAGQMMELGHAATAADFASAAHGYAVSGAAKTALTDGDLAGTLAAFPATGPTTAQAAAVAALANGLPSAAPDCAGLTVSACQAAFAADGFTATATSSTATFTGADVTHPAETVIEQSPGAGVTSPKAGAIVLTVNPVEADMPFAIPRPFNYETYDDYIARLASLGYVGTITENDLTDETADTTVGPNGVPRLQLQLGTDTTSTTLNRSAWPTTVPRARRGVSIQVWRNPGDVPSPPPDPTDDVPNPDPGAGGGGGGSGSCSCPPLNLGPLESLNAGSQFPFGVFTWLASSYDGIGSTPLAIHLGGVDGGPGIDQELGSSEWVSTYRPRIFGVAEFLLTLLAVVAVARWGLGLGDHGE
jgi:hypothetical protein